MRSVLLTIVAFGLPAICSLVAAQHGSRDEIASGSQRTTSQLLAPNFPSIQGMQGSILGPMTELPSLRQGAERGDHSQASNAEEYDAHDLSGIWVWSKGLNIGPISPKMPSMTDWGKAKFDSYKPSFGPRAISPSLGNDPLGICDPLGIPRILVQTVYSRPAIEFIRAPREMVQLISGGNRDWRDIWTDGRALPTDSDPTWLGHSVGKWEGDEFVVDSIGFDERTWLDLLGDPHSDEMHLQERYRRADHDTLDLTLIINDPKTYTGVLQNEAVYKLDQDPKAEMDVDFCVPSEEQSFDKEVRNPAGGSPKP